MQTIESADNSTNLTWKDLLSDEKNQPYFSALLAHIENARKNGSAIYPKNSEIFAAFQLCPLERVRVVILGQDPYHGEGQAHGLSFSVPPGRSLPPSLRNIFKELKDDLGVTPPCHGCLHAWAEQGVLLLNSVLTVEANKPASHSNLGWERFTDQVISRLSRTKAKLVFMLWGAYAQKKGAQIDESKHLVLKAAHPSPFSADKGFFGCKHFSKANDFLIKNGGQPIRW